MENRVPDFVGGDGYEHISFGGKKHHWGNVPAVDMLRLQENEGSGLDEDCRLLFAGMCAVVRRHHYFQRRCEVFINDKELDIVARNAILLLTALCFDPEPAAEIMIHLWYSALIPQPLLVELREKVLPLLEDVRNKIHAKPFNGLFSKTWRFGSCTLQLVLQRDQWRILPSYLHVPEGLSTSKAQQVRIATTMAPERKDYLDRSLCAQLPEWRVSKMDFRRNGILLPFGSSKKQNQEHSITQNTSGLWQTLLIHSTAGHIVRL